MVKKVLSLLILVSMVLHCSSRLGILSYIYKNKQHVAYWLGVEEKPISLCDSNYFSSQQLSLDDTHEIPATILQAQEINLFHQEGFVKQFERPFIQFPQEDTLYMMATYAVNSSGIFHPPALV